MSGEQEVNTLLDEFSKLIQEEAYNAYRYDRMPSFETGKIKEAFDKLQRLGCSEASIDLAVLKGIDRAASQHAAEVLEPLLTELEAEQAAALQAFKNGNKLLGRIVGVVGMALLLRDGVENQALLEQMKTWQKEGKITQEDLDKYWKQTCAVPLKDWECNALGILQSEKDRKDWILKNIIQPKIDRGDIQEIREIYRELSGSNIKRQSFQPPQFMDGDAVGEEGRVILAGYGMAGASLSELRDMATRTFTFKGKTYTPDNSAIIARIDAIEANDISEDIEAMKSQLEEAADALGISLKTTMVEYQRGQEPKSRSRDV